MAKRTKEPLKYSMNTIWSEEDSGFIATVKEFPGLSAFGETRSEAIREAEIALEGFLEVYKEGNIELPPPETARQFSGQLRVRLPKSLHASLSEEADREGVSLNSHINHLLSERHYLRDIEKEIDVLKRCMQSMQISVFTPSVQEIMTGSDTPPIFYINRSGA